MENVSSYAEAYKDVIHEDAIKIGGATKAPDYCFRIGGTGNFSSKRKNRRLISRPARTRSPIHLRDDFRAICGSGRPLLNATSRSHSIPPASLQKSRVKSRTNRFTARSQASVNAGWCLSGSSRMKVRCGLPTPKSRRLE
jgi:hypothetical protein